MLDHKTQGKIGSRWTHFLNSVIKKTFKYHFAKVHNNVHSIRQSGLTNKLNLYLDDFINKLMTFIDWMNIQKHQNSSEVSLQLHVTQIQTTIYVTIINLVHTLNNLTVPPVDSYIYYALVSMGLRAFIPLYGGSRDTFHYV